MGIEQFKPGWFRSTIESAVISIRAGHDRRAAESYGHKDPFPLSWDDAEALASKMDERFESWTGRTLAQHFAARKSPGCG